MRSLLREIWRRDPVLALAGWLQLIALAAVLVVAPFDEREILGINRWIKPMKFLVSVAIYLWTVAWFMPYVSGPRWSKALIRWSVAAALVVENACIVMQSVRGVQSHFNVSTAFDGINFGTMGIMILINTLMLVLLLLLMFVKPLPTLPRPYIWAVRLGLLFIVLGSLEGAYMIGQKQTGLGMPEAKDEVPHSLPL